MNYQADEEEEYPRNCRKERRGHGLKAARGKRGGKCVSEAARRRMAGRRRPVTRRMKLN